ncbi:hypothetical protein RB195_017239 [Necator americanus]|uniref:Uncharacterized protein n=1 Tax=Necator americanus TaxID=51031 RepID=A0ABR1C6D2_NECAM
MVDERMTSSLVATKFTPPTRNLKNNRDELDATHALMERTSRTATKRRRRRRCTPIGEVHIRPEGNFLWMCREKNVVATVPHNSLQEKQIAGKISGKKQEDRSIGKSYG